MKAILRLLAASALLLPMLAAAHLFVVSSPTHGQTFAYGSEQHQAWLARGADRHLALTTEFTNDPYVDRTTRASSTILFSIFPKCGWEPMGAHFITIVPAVSRSPWRVGPVISWASTR